MIFTRYLNHMAKLQSMFCSHSLFVTPYRVTVVKDPVTRESKGVAFILFVRREDAINAAKALNGHEVGGRFLKVKVATDNGRSKEFIKKKIYKDKSFCYECGVWMLVLVASANLKQEKGHMSYLCPKNELGDRIKLTKKQRKKEKAAK